MLNIPSAGASVKAKGVSLRSVNATLALIAFHKSKVCLSLAALASWIASPDFLCFLPEYKSYATWQASYIADFPDSLVITRHLEIPVLINGPALLFGS